MRGVIDNSTHTTTTIGSQTNISGPVNIQMSQGRTEPSPEELLARARQELQTRQYTQMAETLKQVLQRTPSAVDPHFYLGLATFQGHRPKLASLATVRTAESYLRAAAELDRGCGHALLLWALVKEDAYVLNRMNDPEPKVPELLNRVRSVDRGHLAEIVAHVPAPGNRVWEWAGNRLK